MKHRNVHCFMIAIGLLVWTAAPALADKYEETITVFKKSESVLPFFENAFGYAVFPTIGKAGIGIGGQKFSFKPTE